jgi:hypothetical protein
MKFLVSVGWCYHQPTFLLKCIAVWSYDQPHKINPEGLPAYIIHTPDFIGGYYY